MIAVLLTAAAVGAANALNNYLERESDRFMARTQNRPLPTGRMNPNVALVFGLVLGVLSIVSLTLLVNPLSGMLTAMALIIYVMVYTPLKRQHSVNTIVGAIPGALPPLIGWTSATNSLDIGGLLLFTTMFLWQIPHFLAIAIYRQREYENAGLVMFPSHKGIESTRQQMLLYTLALFPLPLLLFLASVVSWASLVIGTFLGGWWLQQAWNGYVNSLREKWARKFFLSSLVYLSGLFVLMSVDGILMALL